MAPSELQPPLNFADGGSVNWASDATVYNTQNQIGSGMATPGGFGGMSSQFTTSGPFGYQASPAGTSSNNQAASPTDATQSENGSTSGHDFGLGSVLQPQPVTPATPSPVVGSFSTDQYNSVAAPLSMANGGKVGGANQLVSRLRHEFSARGLDLDRFILQKAQEKGTNGDTILAHINPQEAEMLKKNGGSGTVNPHTGLMQFGMYDNGSNGDPRGASESTGLSSATGTDDSGGGHEASSPWTAAAAIAPTVSPTQTLNAFLGHATPEERAVINSGSVEIDQAYADSIKQAALAGNPYTAAQIKQLQESAAQQAFETNERALRDAQKIAEFNAAKEQAAKDAVASDARKQQTSNLALRNTAEKTIYDERAHYPIYSPQYNNLTNALVDLRKTTLTDAAPIQAAMKVAQDAAVARSMPKAPAGSTASPLTTAAAAANSASTRQQAERAPIPAPAPAPSPAIPAMSPLTIAAADAAKQAEIQKGIDLGASLQDVSFKNQQQIRNMQEENAATKAGKVQSDLNKQNAPALNSLRIAEEKASYEPTVPAAPLTSVATANDIKQANMTEQLAQNANDVYATRAGAKTGIGSIDTGSPALPGPLAGFDTKKDQSTLPASSTAYGDTLMQIVSNAIVPSANAAEPSLPGLIGTPAPGVPLPQPRPASLDMNQGNTSVQPAAPSPQLPANIPFPQPRPASLDTSGQAPVSNVPFPQPRPPNLGEQNLLDPIINGITDAFGNPIRTIVNGISSLTPVTSIYNLSTGLTGLPTTGQIAQNLFENATSDNPLDNPFMNSPQDTGRGGTTSSGVDNTRISDTSFDPSGRESTVPTPVAVQTPVIIPTTPPTGTETASTDGYTGPLYKLRQYISNPNVRNYGFGGEHVYFSATGGAVNPLNNIGK